MSLNHAEIDLVLAELELAGSRIQAVVQPSYDTLLLELWKPGKTSTLLLCIAPGACRLHATTRNFPKPERPLRFAELLKSRIRNGKIAEARQLGADRIVRLSVETQEGAYLLYARLWSNAANVVLADAEGTVIDAMARRPKRGEVSGGRYRPEESPPKPLPEGKVFPLRDASGYPDYGSMLDAYYEKEGGSLSREAVRERLRRYYGARISKAEGIAESLARNLEAHRSALEGRRYGDIILANLWRAGPGASWLEAEDFTRGDEPIRIPLDPRKDAKENARDFYEGAKKAKASIAEIEEDIAAKEKLVRKLRADLAALDSAGDPMEIERRLRKLRARETARERKKAPGLDFESRGWTILVGRSATENEELLRRHVKGGDYWLHARDWPGAYVFIRQRRGRSPELEVLLDAGCLALFYSGGRNSGKGELYYTQVKHLRRPKDGPKGLVLPTQEKNLSVRLDMERIRRLKGDES